MLIEILNAGKMTCFLVCIRSFCKFGALERVLVQKNLALNTLSGSTIKEVEGEGISHEALILSPKFETICLAEVELCDYFTYNSPNLHWETLNNNGFQLNHLHAKDATKKPFVVD